MTGFGPAHAGLARALSSSPASQGSSRLRRLGVRTRAAQPDGDGTKVWRREDQAECISALRTRSAVLRAPSLRMASARWLSNVLGLMFIRKAPCLLEHPSLIRPSTSRSRFVSGFWPDSDANITPGARPPSL